MTIFWYLTRIGGKNTTQFCCICQEFTTQESPSQLGKDFPTGVKSYIEYFRFGLTLSCSRTPFQDFFRAHNERREAKREGRGQTDGEGRYKDNELVNRTDLYFRHAGAHVRHPDPRFPIKLDRLIVLSKSNLLGWFLHVSLIPVEVPKTDNRIKI